MGGSPKEIRCTLVEQRYYSSLNSGKDDDIAIALSTGLLELEMEDDGRNMFDNVPLIGEYKYSNQDNNSLNDVTSEESSSQSCIALPLTTPSERCIGKNCTTISSSLDHAGHRFPANENSTRKSRVMNSKVKFANILIREYDIVIGDHPCCTLGCPLSLGWDYSDSKAVVTIDEYEANRPPRRSRSNLKTSWEQRKQMLSHIPNVEVRKAQRRSYRERSCRTRVCAGFFGDLPPPISIKQVDDITEVPPEGAQESTPTSIRLLDLSAISLE